MTFARRLPAAVLVLILSLAAGPAVAAEGGPRNQVVTRNHVDGSTMHRAKTRLVVIKADADPANVADARSSCRSCRNVAVAVQAVVFDEGATTSSPQNVAIALNSGCSSCATFASAYQRVWTTPGDFVLSDEAAARTAQLREEIDQAAASSLPFPDLDAELDRLVAELWATIDAEVARAGEAADAQAGAAGWDQD